VSDRSGGPAQAIFPMCRALGERGVEVLVATTDAQLAPEKVRMETPTEYKGVSTIFFPTQWGDSFKFSQPMSVWLDENVNGFDLVHIHAVFNHSSLIAARACRKNGVPYIVRPLGTLDPWSMQRKRIIKTAFWFVTGKKMLREAAAVHYTTKAEMLAVENSLSVTHGAVVPLGIELGETGNHFASSTPHAEQHIPPAEPYVVVMSRLHSKKGLEVLIDAFAEVVRSPEFSNWQLVLAGDGAVDYVSSLKDKAKSTNCSHQIHFPGWLDGEDKKVFLRRAALLVLPSFQENFGLCVLEALTIGTPVLVSPHVNLAETIAVAGAGWIADVNKDALAKTLKDALSSESELTKRGQAGAELAKLFGWPQIAGELVALYQGIVNDRLIPSGVCS
jgi:glycosyltransferase involved in cell wall biosynthesis